MRKFLTALALTAVLVAGIGSAVSVATPEYAFACPHHP